MAPVQPWRSREPNLENEQLVSLTTQAWRDAGHEHMKQAGTGTGVKLAFLKAIQGYSPTTFNNSTCLKWSADSVAPKTTMLVRTPLRPKETK